ncbi:hypothetical protein BS78_02G291800 [Paspalum vaginatum]|nr:hypothetical protein BS78_02G291800 [Paspalum vaginatum]
MPTMMVIPAAIRKLRREALEISRRRAVLASTGGVAAKKKLYSPPAPRLADNSDRARLERRLRSTPSACAPAEIVSRCIGTGAQVRVRTRVGTACTGHTLVFWLRAVVVSAADEDGYLRVAYTYVDGKLPRVARVPPSDIKLHVLPSDDARSAASDESSTVVTGDHSAPPPPSQLGKAAAPRPTVAGKKLPLLMKLEKEMRSRSKA